ncbi:MAG TPA: YfdX family protein [Myxococcota bacterium]|nr:YfdX family protein [Myxococcota bacterium]
MRYRTSQFAVGALVVAAVCLGTQAVKAQDSAQFKQVSFTVLTPTNQKIVTQTAGVAAAQIDDANKAMAGTDPINARWEVAKARQLVGTLRQVSPAARLDDSLGSAKKAIKSGNSQGALTPVYEQLDEYTSLKGVLDVRPYVEKAKGHLGAGQTDLAITDIDTARANITYIEIDLPLKRVYGELTRGMVSLDHKDVLTAQDRVSAAKRDFTPVVKVVSAKLVETVAEEEVEPAQ